MEPRKLKQGHANDAGIQTSATKDTGVSENRKEKETMSFEILHIRDAENILKKKKLDREVRLTMEYLDDVLYGSTYRRELLRQALEETGWRESKELNILDGRRYCYKGLKKGVAIEGNLSSYEYVQDGLLRLQIGYDKQRIEMGIVLVTAKRSEKSRLGSTRELVEKEIEMLYPTISLPVTIALFDLGETAAYMDKAEREETEREAIEDIMDPDMTDEQDMQIAA